MQTEPHIDFQGMAPSASFREQILQQIVRLEERYGRMTACRVVVKAPGGHHHTGGLYEVNIYLSLPDERDVSVDRTPHQDERFSRFDFALHDAFNRAARQLQDQVARMRGKVKQHEAPPVAVVRRMMREEGYGFLESDDGREIYFHRNSVEDSRFDELQPGARVRFREDDGDKGPQATQVTLLNERAPD